MGAPGSGKIWPPRVGYAAYARYGRASDDETNTVPSARTTIAAAWLTLRRRSGVPPLANFLSFMVALLCFLGKLIC